MSETHSAEIHARTRDELVKGVRMAITSWNVLGPRKAGEDVSEFIADWLIVNRVTPPEATPTTNAARPEGDDSSAREGITAR